MDTEHTEEKDLEGKTTPTMKNNLRRGVEFFNSKRYEQAILEWSKVLREDPTNKKALDFIIKARARISKAASPEDNAKVAGEAQSCFKIGLQYFEEEEYQMAINQWIRTLTYQPDNADALSYIRQAQAKMEEGAAPTKAKPGAPAPAAKMLKDSESGAFPREEVKAPAAAAAKAKPKAKEEDNKRLAAEAEALYEEILGGPGSDIEGGGAPKKGGFQQVKVGKRAAAAAPREPGFASQLLSFPMRHSLAFGGIVVVAAGVFVTLYFLFLFKDYATLVADANKNIQAGNWFDARNELAVANRKKPHDLEILLLLGQCDVELKNWDDAIGGLKEVTEGSGGSPALDPKSSKAWFLTALSLYKKNDFELALKSVKEAVRSGERGAEIKKLVSDIGQQIGNPKLVFEVFGESDIENQPPEVLVQLGIGDLLAQDYAEAKKKAEMALDKAPQDEEAYLLLAHVLDESGDAKGAMTAAQKGIDSISLCPRLWYLKAHLQVRQDKFEDALNTMREAEGQSGDYRYQMELGNIWVAQYVKTKEGFFKDKAVTAYRKSSDMTDDGYAALAWGRALLAFGDKDGAESKLKIAASRFKGSEIDDFGYSYLWISYYLLEDWDKGIQTLDKAIAAREHKIAALAAKGITLFRKGDKAGAKEAFDAAASEQKGRKIIAPVEYANVSVADVKRMLAEVGL